MKKLAILFLLTTVLVGMSFGQVSFKEELQLNNVGGGNSGDLTPTLQSQVDAAAAKELGPGEISLAAEITYNWSLDGDPSIGNGKGDGGYQPGDVFIQGGYGLPVGPGTLGFFLRLRDFAAWRIGANYAGLAVGPVTLGFEAFFDYEVDDGDVFDGTDKEFIEISANAKFDFGLYIKYGFQYGIGDKAGADGTDGIKKIVYLDANYALLDGALTVGLEVDDTGDEFKAFTLKPYAGYSLSENTTLGASIKVHNINADGAADDILISPAVYYKYTF
jgi:hypothetical protein